MKKWIEYFARAVLVLFAAVGVAGSFLATPDVAVIKACQVNGYWQTGQIRVLCVIQRPQAVPPLNLLVGGST